MSKMSDMKLFIFGRITLNSQFITSTKYSDKVIGYIT
jgi:hypothetical protein